MDKVLRKIFTTYSDQAKNPAVLVSGGIDSSVIAWWVKKTFGTLTPFCLRGKDDSYVEKLCRYLKVRPIWVNHHLVDLESIKNKLEQIGISSNITQLSLAVALYLLLEQIAKRKITLVFSGQGPDVLLAGYARYRGVKNLNQKIKDDLVALEIDKKREEAIAAIFGVKMVYPYLAKEFVEYSLGLPASAKIKGEMEKYALRQYGRSLGLPKAIYTRPKMALQYSTGIQKELCGIMPLFKG